MRRLFLAASVLSVLAAVLALNAGGGSQRPQLRLVPIVTGLNEPVHIAAPRNEKHNVYVVDSQDNRVEIFSSAGTFISSFGGAGTLPGHFNTPVGIASDGHGNFWVSDAHNARVEEFDRNGTFELSVPGSGPGQLGTPEFVAVDTSTGELYVADDTNNQVVLYTNQGLYDGTIGSAGTANTAPSAG